MCRITLAGQLLESLDVANLTYMICIICWCVCVLHTTNQVNYLEKDIFLLIIMNWHICIKTSTLRKGYFSTNNNCAISASWHCTEFDEVIFPVLEQPLTLSSEVARIYNAEIHLIYNECEDHQLVADPR